MLEFMEELKDACNDIEKAKARAEMSRSHGK